MIEVPVGQRLDTVTSATAGVTAGISDSFAGAVELAIDNTVADGATVDLTATFTTAISTNVQTFQTNNNAAGPGTALEGWKFEAGSTHKQVRLLNESANTRMLIPAPTWRAAVSVGDDIATAQYAMNPVVIRPGTTRQPHFNNLDFAYGGGADQAHSPIDL